MSEGVKQGQNRATLQAKPAPQAGRLQQQVLDGLAVAGALGVVEPRALQPRLLPRTWGANA